MTPEDSVTSPDMEVSVLRRVSQIVSSGIPLDGMLDEIVKLAQQTTGCDACLVYLIEEPTAEFVLRASMLPHAADVGKLRMKMGEGVTGWVAEHQAPVALDSQASTDARFKSFPALVEDTYEAFLSVPVVSKGKAIGVINVHHRERHPHSSGEIATLSFIGEQMGGAIAKTLLEEENAEMKRQLETRKAVERAKGLLQRRLNLTEEEAYLRLRSESRRLRRPMRELAEAIILSEELSRKEPPPQS